MSSIHNFHKKNLRSHEHNQHYKSVGLKQRFIHIYFFGDNDSGSQLLSFRLIDVNDSLKIGKSGQMLSPGCDCYKALTRLPIK